MIIDEHFLELMAQPNAFSLGKKAYKKNLVQDINVGIMKDSMGNDEIIISSEVQGEEDRYLHDVDISIDIEKKIIRNNCSCKTINTPYGSSTMCRHVIATLFEYINEDHQMNIHEVFKKNRFENRTREIAEALDRFTGNHDKEIINFEILLYKSFNKNSCSYLELRVGKKKLYVVKDIFEFVEAVTGTKIVSFGKNFDLDMSKQYFSKDDKKIVDIIINYVNYYKMFQGRDNCSISRKQVFLTDEIFDKIIKVSVGKSISFHSSLDYCEYKVEVLQRQLPVKISMAKETGEEKDSSDIIILEKPKTAPISLNRNKDIYLFNKKIYILSEESHKLYGILDSYFSSYENKFVLKDEFENKILRNIARLDNFEESIEIEDRLKKKIIKEELKIETYLDRISEGIILKLIFNYGEEKINPLKQTQSEKIILRDRSFENTVLDTLKNYKLSIYEDKYLISNIDEIVDFISYAVEDLKKLSTVYYSDSFRNFKLKKVDTIKTSIKVEKEDFLEVNFEIPDINKDEIKDIMSAISDNKKYYKLSDGNILVLDEGNGIKVLNNLIDTLDKKENFNGSITLSKSDIFYIDGVFNSYDFFDVKKDEEIEEILCNIKNTKDSSKLLPGYLSDVMRDYQKVGFNWFKTLSTCNFGGILADEMGLGKTLQSIAFLIEEKTEIPHLVVCPTSLIYNWEEEVNKFASDLKTLVITGDKNARIDLIKDYKNYDIIITSYPLLIRDLEEYRKLDFNIFVIDEAQKIKNSSNVTTKGVKSISSRLRFALTGTPMENSLAELWSIFDFVLPGYLMDYKSFNEKFKQPITKLKDKEVSILLSNKIRPFMLRRLKNEVVKELPDKIEETIIVNMNEEQKKLYSLYVKKLLLDVEQQVNENGLNKSRFKILSAITRLRQICCDPSVFLNDYDKGSGKIEALQEILEETTQAGHKVLVFSQFTSVLKNISEILEKSKIKFKYLDGSIKAKDRVSMVEEFNTGDDSVFLISLMAGGTGLNLTAADVVIHFDPWWNPAVEDQATDRAHRIGQKNTVQVIKLIAKGTIEEKVQKLQKSKKEMIQNIIDEDNNMGNVFSSMNFEEIKELFEI